MVFEVAPPALAFTTNLPTTKSVAAGSALTMSVVVEGGTSPYTYVWKKDGTVVSGQTTATFNKASSVSGDAGVYTCEVTDSAATPVKITAVACTVTIS
ncbi:phage tail protein [Klebsiella pneumoniae]|nr:phage tail protein [Klebsiella pneumoniae]